MMEAQDTQVDEVTVKMEKAAVEEQDKGKEESKEESQDVSQDAGKDVTTSVTVKEEKQDSPMEVEETKEEPQTSKEDVPMETEPVLPATTEAAEITLVKMEESASNSNNDKNFEEESKPTKEEKEAEVPVADEKMDKEEEKKEEKNSPSEEKIESILSASPDVAKETSPMDVPSELPDEWDIAGTDDEKEELTDKKTTGVWMPDAKVIIDLYQKLDKEGILELQWKCPGRRTPPREVDEEKEVEVNPEEEDTKPEIEEEKQEEEPTEFDFDVETPSITSMAPRRTPGSGALGSGKKRVAQMDKIFNDMMRHKRIDEELARVGDESDDAGNRTDTTPQRHVGKFRIRKDF